MNILMLLCKDTWMSRNLSEGWRQLGCTVDEFFYGTHMGKSWTPEGIRENQLLNANILDKAKLLKAKGQLDLIFSVIYDDVLTIETAQKLRSLDVPMVNYHVDMIGQWYRVLRTGKYFDLVACAQLENQLALKEAGIRPFYMPMAANPPSPQDLTSTTPHPFEGVVYLGSPWDYRRQILAGLADSGFPLNVYGYNWLRKTPDPANTQSWAKTFHDLQYYLWRRLKHERFDSIWETIQKRIQPSLPAGLASELPASCLKGSYPDSSFIGLVQGAAINLGFTHFQGKPNSVHERRQVRLRDFEIPMTGGFYLTQHCSELEELFCIGENLITWDNPSDLHEKARFYLENPNQRTKIAKASQAHCLTNHTWANRFNDLLNALHLPTPNLINI
jgi:spore maturation protein CgeB